MPDYDPRPDGGRLGTWTREQLLEMRGYDEATIAGNGHAPTAFTRERVNDGPPALEGEAPVGRTCRGCGASLEGRATVWCGQRCKRRFYENRRRRAPKAARPAPTRPEPAAAPSQPSGSMEPVLAALIAASGRLSGELTAGGSLWRWSLSKEN